MIRSAVASEAISEGVISPGLVSWSPRSTTYAGGSSVLPIKCRNTWSAWLRSVVPSSPIGEITKST